MNTALMCLAMALYFEVRSEPLAEQYRVAEVIMNRVDSPKYPADVCAVIKQDLGRGDHDCQFSFYCDGKNETIHNAEAFERSLGVSVDVLITSRVPLLPKNTMWYHTRDVAPSWATRLERVNSDGAHFFYTPLSAD